jgi:hypothetical protein
MKILNKFNFLMLKFFKLRFLILKKKKSIVFHWESSTNYATQQPMFNRP